MKQQVQNLVSVVALIAALGFSGTALAESTQTQTTQQPPAVAMSPDEVLDRMSGSPRVHGYMKQQLEYLERSSKPESIDAVEVSIQL